MTMPFNVGDKVKYLNEKGGGIVRSIIDEHMVLIEDEEGFTFQVAKSALVSEGKSAVDEKEIRARLKEKVTLSRDTHTANHDYHDYHMKVRDYLMQSRLNWTSKDKDFVEVDLHIEELVEKPRNLRDGQKLHYQLEHARHCLDAAVDMKIRRVVFIHGVGAGVLRHELRQWLKSLGYVEIINANYQRYGMGATEVRIFSS